MALRYYQSAGIDRMLQEVGVPVAYISGGQLYECPGVVDEADEEMLSGEAATFAGRVTIATVKTGVLPGIGDGARLTLDGIDYRVAQTRRIGDGALTQLWCVPV